jgi:hypothetical protein
VLRFSGCEHMHELRSAVLSGEKPRETPVVSREKCRRRVPDSAGSLIGIEIPREEQRQTNQRREDRFLGIVDRATLVFRRKKSLVRVVNVSPSGLMIDSNITPNIGEKLTVVFDGHEELKGVVRWVRQGRIGLDVGDGSIELG